jgi:hypothetical protein
VRSRYQLEEKAKKLGKADYVTWRSAKREGISLAEAQKRMRKIEREYQRSLGEYAKYLAGQ